MPFVQTNGIQFFYAERGPADATPVILIMGVTAPGAVWEAHAQEWEKEFRLILGDNRGVGSTDKPAGPYTTEQMADDYAGVIESLGLGKAHVIGCSLGSVIAQQLALRHPDKVKSLVLMCTWARQDAYGLGVWKHLQQAKAALRPEDFLHFIQLLIFSKSWWDDEGNQKGMADGRAEMAINPNPQPLHALEAQAAAATAHNTLDVLGNINVPTLVIGGENDVFTPAWMAKEVAQAIPNAELHLYPDAGHAFHWEKITDFNPRILKWLKEH